MRSPVSAGRSRGDMSTPQKRSPTRHYLLTTSDKMTDLSATNDSGISMSHRRVFGRRMWVELAALLPWFCGGAVGRRVAAAGALFKTPLPPGMMFRAGCPRPYRG